MGSIAQRSFQYHAQSQLLQIHLRRVWIRTRVRLIKTQSETPSYQGASSSFLVIQTYPLLQGRVTHMYVQWIFQWAGQGAWNFVVVAGSLKAIQNGRRGWSHWCLLLSQSVPLRAHTWSWPVKLVDWSRRWFCDRSDPGKTVFSGNAPSPEYFDRLTLSPVVKAWTFHRNGECWHFIAEWL